MQTEAINAILTFLRRAEALKHTYRSAWTSTGDPESVAWGINLRGEVAGTSGQVFDDLGLTAVRWDADGLPMALPPLPWESVTVFSRTLRMRRVWVSRITFVSVFSSLLEAWLLPYRVVFRSPYPLSPKGRGNRSS